MGCARDRRTRGVVAGGARNWGPGLPKDTDESLELEAKTDDGDAAVRLGVENLGSGLAKDAAELSERGAEMLCGGAALEVTFFLNSG